MSLIRAFFGLEDSGDRESSSRRRTDYMKKIQPLVVPSEDEDDEDAPENIVSAPTDDPEPENSTAEPEREPVQDDEPSEEEEPRRRRFGAHEEKKSFASHFLHVGDSLRRSQENAGSLILVRAGAQDMIEDIQDALTQGQMVLLDFEREDRKQVSAVLTKLVNFVRLHNGGFYTVTRTSMLLSLRRDCVTEWRPGGDAGEQ